MNPSTNRNHRASRLSDADIAAILAERSAVITGSHLVYAQPKGRGDHGDAYVNKDAIYPDTDAVSALCRELAHRLEPVMNEGSIDVVVGPEKGGIILSQWLAHWLNDVYPPGEGDPKTLSAYAEKAEGGGFVLRRGYDKIVSGRRVVVIEDILNSGGSAKDAVATVVRAGGTVVAVAAICNRGSVTAESIGAPFLTSLLSLDLKKYPESDCPHCKAGIPVRTDLGHGAEFLARRQCVLV